MILCLQLHRPLICFHRWKQHSVLARLTGKFAFLTHEDDLMHLGNLILLQPATLSGHQLLNMMLHVINIIHALHLHDLPQLNIHLISHPQCTHAMFTDESQLNEDGSA